MTKGTVLWTSESMEAPKTCLFVYEADSIELKTPSSYKWPVNKLQPGNFIGDFPSIVAKKEPKTEAYCIKDCQIIEVQSSELLQFLGKNPGMKLMMREEYIIF
jgi:hypothetical protein